jgi:putative phosphoesterase
LNLLILSDTHGYLDEQVLKHARQADLICHAGDIGNVALVEKLSASGSLKAVYGNIDGQYIRKSFPEYDCFRVEEVKLLMIHIGGYPGNYARGVKNLIAACRPALFICGHSHILRIERDPEFGGMLCINPGAAGISGFHHERTMVRMEIDGGAVRNVDVINLGQRSGKNNKEKG